MTNTGTLRLTSVQVISLLSIPPTPPSDTRSVGDLAAGASVEIFPGSAQVLTVPAGTGVGAYDAILRATSAEGLFVEDRKSGEVEIV